MVYQVELFYGYENSDTGIYHAFLAEDPSDQRGEEMSDELAEMLDLDTDDESFYWDSMYINLPDSLVKRIKDDAVREYLKVGRDDGQ